MQCGTRYSSFFAILSGSRQSRAGTLHDFTKVDISNFASAACWLVGCVPYLCGLLRGARRAFANCNRNWT